MKRRFNYLPLILIVVLTASCSFGPKWTPLKNPDQLFEYEGFTYLPPKGENWGNLGNGNLIFAKKNEDRFHTVVARVGIKFIANDELKKGTKVILNQIAQKSIDIQLNQQKEKNRFKLIDFQKSIENTHHSVCIHWDFKFEDHAVPNKEDTVFILEGQSLACIHPELPNMVVALDYSERFEPDTIQQKYTKEADRFLKSLTFKPIGLKITPIPVGRFPQIPNFGNGSIWVSNYTSNTVSRIDPTTNKVIATINVGHGPNGISTSKGAVWVNNNKEGTVSKIDSKTNKVIATIEVGGFPNLSRIVEGNLWVVNAPRSYLTIIDTQSNEVIHTINVADNPDMPQAIYGIGLVESTIWVANSHNMGGFINIYNVNTREKVDSILFLSAGPAGMLVAEDSVWVASRFSDIVYRFDLKTKEVLAKINVGSGPSNIAYFQGKIWVTKTADNYILRIDPKTNKLTGKPLYTGNGPGNMTVIGDSLWVTQVYGNFVSRIEPK